MTGGRRIQPSAPSRRAATPVASPVPGVGPARRREAEAWDAAPLASLLAPSSPAGRAPVVGARAPERRAAGGPA